MGSWSESCGFSGIEIGEGEVAYVAFLGKPKYTGNHGPQSHWELRTPLIRGTYNDYGYLNVADDEAVLALFNQMSGLALKNGDDFADRDEHFVEGLERFWIRGDVLESLERLTPDFPYFWPRAEKADKSIKFKRIGDGADLQMADIRKAVAKAKTAQIKWHSIKDGLSDVPVSEKFDIIAEIRLRETFGYSRIEGIDWCDQAQNALLDDAKIEAILTAYRRNYVLEYGALELRRKFTPSERIGPQHGGEIASCQFAREILKIQRVRKKRWDD